MLAVLNFYHLGKVIPEGAEYIGRPMPNLGLKGSKFANPFKLNENESRGDTIGRYRVWLWEQIKTGKITVKDLLALSGKDLVCFCKHKTKEVACHGDIVQAAVLWAEQTKKQRGETH